MRDDKSVLKHIAILCIVLLFVPLFGIMAHNCLGDDSDNNYLISVVDDLPLAEIETTPEICHSFFVGAVFPEVSFIIPQTPSVSTDTRGPPA